MSFLSSADLIAALFTFVSFGPDVFESSVDSSHVRHVCMRFRVVDKGGNSAVYRSVCIEVRKCRKAIEQFYVHAIDGGKITTIINNSSGIAPILTSSVALFPPPGGDPLFSDVYSLGMSARGVVPSHVSAGGPKK